MSRKTKKKSTNYGILPNGQVVRRDTLEGWSEERRGDAQGYVHGELDWDEIDIDHTREHREKLKAVSRKATENAKKAGLIK